MPKLASALREPLLHFLALGALIFLAYAWLGESAPDADAIVVSRGQQINLLETFERTWGRAPTGDEFAGLVEDYLREEIAYREASARELDRNDIVIRRRLRQKLELLANLRSGASVAAEVLAGDSRVLPRELAAAGELQIAATFGDEFLSALDGLTQGAWEGPVASGFGWHLVRVGERIPGEVPLLAEIADRVQTELLVERRLAALELLYATLAERALPGMVFRGAACGSRRPTRARS